ncbi:hypothetical protein L6R52_23560, partial [Myxococcota bacterium]|nr:hypothetical protein [Myxococcota bacterium]
IATSAGDEITWAVTDGALVRRDARGPWVLSRWGARVTATPWEDRGFEGTITLSRELLPGRPVSAERSILARRTVR